MKLLVLGGTVFLGRQVVAQALEAGHEVTMFTRGHTKPWLFPEAEHLTGDRDGNLGALTARTWDAVIDTSGYLPRIVRQSGELLRDAVGRYVFVSSLSAYADHSRPYDERAPTAELEDPSTEDVWANYGALKAACESVLDAIYGQRATHVRAGLIVGPHDPTNRFTYWCERVAEGGDLLAPDHPERPVQFIDARDLARWMLKLAGDGPCGPLNATGPASRLTMGRLLERMIQTLGSHCRIHWIDGGALLSEGVQPWRELPFWLPGREYESLLEADITLALSAGLGLRPLEATILDTIEWARTAGEQRPALTRTREKELLEKYA